MGDVILEVEQGLRAASTRAKGGCRGINHMGGVQEGLGHSTRPKEGDVVLCLFQAVLRGEHL